MDRQEEGADPHQLLHQLGHHDPGGAAVAQVRGVEIHGKLAFTAWLGVHAALMTGGSNRVSAFKAWAVDYFGKERAPQAFDRSGTPRMDWEEDDVVAAAAAVGDGR